MKAVTRQDILNALLVAGADPNKLNDAGQSPLDISVAAGDVDSVKYLLGSGAQVVHDLLNDEDRSALRLCIRSCNLIRLKNLLMKNPKLINFREKTGNTLFHLASEAGCDAIIEYLVAEGVSLTARSHTGETALHVAVRSGRIHTVECLLACGAPVNLPNEEGDTSLHIAWHLPQMIKILIMAGADTGFMNLMGACPLHNAAKNGAVDALQKLLDHNAKINVKDFDGRAALHTAVRYPDAVSFLIDQNAEVDCPDFYGETPLHVASQEGCTESAIKLIAAGADVSLQNHHGDTPLHFAALKGEKEIVQLLLEAGSNPDIPNIRGYTPLHSIALTAIENEQKK